MGRDHSPSHPTTGLPTDPWCQAPPSTGSMALGQRRQTHSVRLPFFCLRTPLMGAGQGAHSVLLGDMPTEKRGVSMRYYQLNRSS